MVTFAFVLVKPRLRNSLVEFLKGACTTAVVDLQAIEGGVRRVVARRGRAAAVT